MIDPPGDVLVQLRRRHAPRLEGGGGRLGQQLLEALQLRLQLSIVILQDLHARLQAPFVLAQQPRLGQHVVVRLLQRVLQR